MLDPSLSFLNNTSYVLPSLFVARRPSSIEIKTQPLILASLLHIELDMPAKAVTLNTTGHVRRVWSLGSILKLPCGCSCIGWVVAAYVEFCIWYDYSKYRMRLPCICFLCHFCRIVGKDWKAFVEWGNPGDSEFKWFTMSPKAGLTNMLFA